jgi:hypothetical protein
VTTRGGGLLLSSFGGGDQDVEPLLEGLGVDGRKDDDVRWHDDQRRGGWTVALRAARITVCVCVNSTSVL